MDMQIIHSAHAYTCTFHLMRTNCTPHTQPGRGVVIIAPPTVRYSEQILYAAILRRASHCVRYPEFEGCPLFGCFYCIIGMETAVGVCNGVRYSVDVRYWECPLIESPLYTHSDRHTHTHILWSPFPPLCF